MMSLHHAVSREAYLRDVAECVTTVRGSNSKTAATEVTYA